MNNGILYHSVLAAYMESYLERQYALGHKAEDVKYSLIVIDKYLSEIGLRSEHINKQTSKNGWLRYHGRNPPQYTKGFSVQTVIAIHVKTGH